MLSVAPLIVEFLRSGGAMQLELSGSDALLGATISKGLWGVYCGDLRSTN